MNLLVSYNGGQADHLFHTGDFRGRGRLLLSNETLEIRVADSPVIRPPLQHISNASSRNSLFSSGLVLHVTFAPRECLEYMEQDMLRLGGL